MWLPVRRAVVMGMCIAVWIFSGLAAIGEITQNHGLWTLGGSVGMARATIACFFLLSIAVFLLALNGSGGPFRPAP